MVRYLIINPVNGQPVVGSQRHYPDGMEIYKVTVMVDSNGDLTDDVGPYDLYLANDFEDGLAAIQGDGNAVYVWIDFDGANLTLDFYDKNIPRNGNELGDAPGCQVQINFSTVDLVNRTFDYSSTGDCFGHGTDVAF